MQNKDILNEKNIKIYKKNPSYFQYKGKPILLIGGSKEDNLFQIDKLNSHLDKLKQAGGNYVRCTMSSRDEGNIWPYEKKDNNIYDLNQWNPKFWKRFENFLEATHTRNIIVQIELWATFDFYSVWDNNPYNPRNNINYSADETGLPESVTSDPPLNQNTFFWSVPELGYLEEILYYQQRYIDKLLSYSFKYPNILYCIDNETHVPSQWANYWAGYVKNQARKINREIEITEMFWQKDLTHPQHKEVYNQPNLFSFWDISQNNLLHGQPHWNNQREGQVHWDRIMKARKKISPLRPLTSVKIYGSNGTGDFGVEQHGQERFWRNIFGGLAAVRFHRPPYGLGLSEKAVKMIKAAKEVMSFIDIFKCSPRNELLQERRENEAYLLANPGIEYAIYFPEQGYVDLKINNNQEYNFRVYDIDNNCWITKKNVSGRKIRINTVTDGQQIIILKVIK